MTDQETQGAAPVKAAGTGGSSFVVNAAAWLIALLLIVALAFAVSQRLGDAVQVVRETIVESRELTSAVRRADLIAPPANQNEAVRQTAPSIDAQGRTVVPPRWIDPPRPEYPRTWNRRLEAGTVTLSCGVTPDGELTTCAIVSESPTDRGFGEAALKSVAGARLSPKTVDGVAEAGQVKFTVRFTPEHRRSN